MSEKSPSEEEQKDKEFAQIGKEVGDYIENKFAKIIYSKEQFSVKLPKRFLERIKWKKGDKLKIYLVVPKDENKEERLEFEYIRGNKKDGKKKKN